MADQYDSWGTDNSSGFLTEFTGEVTDSWFATNPKVNEGQTLILHWKLENIEPTDPDEETELTEITQNYACGSGWVSEDGGKTASHPAGPKRMFHASTLYGKIIDTTAGRLEGYGDNATTPDGEKVKVDLTGLMDVIRERGNPTDAEVWKGLKFRFSEVRFDYGVNKKTQEKIVSNRTMPVEFLGVIGEEKKVDDKEAKKQAAKAKAAAKKAPVSEATSDVSGAVEQMLSTVEADDTTKNALIDKLTESNTHTEFTDAALEIDGVVENDALMDLVVDEVAGLWSVKS